RRQVGDDRPVRIDEVGGGDPAQVAALRRRAAGLAAPDPDEPEVAVHRPFLVVDAGLQQLAGALLGAALAARVVGLDPGPAAAAGLAQRAAAVGAAVQPGQ